MMALWDQGTTRIMGLREDAAGDCRLEGGVTRALEFDQVQA